MRWCLAWSATVLTLPPRAGLTLQACIEEYLPLIKADAKMLTQVLTNLTTNATNYTPPGGTITVTTARQRAAGRPGVIMAVSDTGPGIPQADQDRLFERFFRGEAARQTGTPGTGLGLAICQEIVRLHGGEITLHSKPGVGSTFVVWLPAGSPEEEA